MTEDFYRAFEDRFRGSRETIKARLRQYLPFVRAMRGMRPGASAIDLGCGRGEWLEIMREEDIGAVGIDSDDSMLQAAREAGFEVRSADAIAFLQASAAQSHDLVTAFHVAEHLHFNELQTLVKEALRVLRPGGLLLLESPDPGNPSVGSSSFYLDPTHVRPLPPDLLAFLPEHYGFRRVKILRFQELAGVADKQAPSLLNVLRDASADFAIVAQKAGGEGDMAGLDSAFGRDFGVTVDTLATRYDAALEARIRNAERAAEQAAARVQQLLASQSWRVTAPLRWIGRALRALFVRPGR